MRILSQGVILAASIVSIVLAGFTPGTTAVLAGSSAKARGAQLFATHGCVRCHGKEGIGGGKGPDLQLVRKRLKAPAIIKQIRGGGMEMPAFGTSFTTLEIKDLVAYLRAKRKVIVPTLPAATQVNPPPPAIAKPNP